MLHLHKIFHVPGFLHRVTVLFPCISVHIPCSGSFLLYQVSLSLSCDSVTCPLCHCYLSLEFFSSSFFSLSFSLQLWSYLYIVKPFLFTPAPFLYPPVSSGVPCRSCSMQHSTLLFPFLFLFPLGSIFSILRAS